MNTTETRLIYVVGFAPSRESPNAVGGYNWFVDRAAAVRCMVQELEIERLDLTWHVVPVPADTTDDQVDDWLMRLYDMGESFFDPVFPPSYPNLLLNAAAADPTPAPPGLVPQALPGNVVDDAEPGEPMTDNPSLRPDWRRWTDPIAPLADDDEDFIHVPTGVNVCRFGAARKYYAYTPYRLDGTSWSNVPIDGNPHNTLESAMLAAEEWVERVNPAHGMLLGLLTEIEDTAPDRATIAGRLRELADLLDP